MADDLSVDLLNAVSSSNRLALAQNVQGVPSMQNRIARFDMRLDHFDSVRPEEVFRLGVLRDGIQLTTLDVRLPIYGQVIPRIELQVLGDNYNKKVTVRVNQLSGFCFDGESLTASINGKPITVAARQYLDPERAPTGMYNFGLLRENGTRSFVFDYHTFCSYSCDFCFKENEWEVLQIQGSSMSTKRYESNFEKCLEYIDSHQEDFRTKYDIVWLCTGSITNAKLELERHCQVAAALRTIGYAGGIYVSQVVPKTLKHDRTARKEYMSALREAGVSRFNTGIEIVASELRKRFIHGFKGEYTFDEYVKIFEDAVAVWGEFNAGSCLLAGVEPSQSTLYGLETIAALGVVPSPTVFTAFVVKQLAIPFQYSLDELIDTNVGFHKIIDRYKLPVFSGVFSLA